jgi:arsenate reductase
MKWRYEVALNSGRRAWVGIMQRKAKVLFLTMGNSTRSQMAEGFLRTLAGDRFLIESAGIQPGTIHPLATEVMMEVGIDISGQESISVAQVLKEYFACVITACDSTKERFPIFPFTFNLLHWNIMDPTTMEGSHSESKEAFRRARDEIEVQVHCFLNITAEEKQEPVALAFK